MAFTFDGFTMDAHNNFGGEEEEEEEEVMPLPAGLHGQEEQVQHELDTGAEEIPIMPPDFYAGVDLFLRKSPPRLKGKKRMDVEASAALGKRDQKSSRSVAAAPRRSVPVPVLRGTLDTSLLHEAFAYTDKILREAVHEEAQAERQARSGNNSGNNNNSHHQLPERRGGSAGSALVPAAAARNPYSDNPRSAPGKGSSAAKDRTGAGLVKRLRQQTQPNSASSSGFDVSRLDDEAARKSEFDNLVLNFQQGLTLKKLQAELAASQQAMRRSEGMVREIAGAAGFR